MWDGAKIAISGPKEVMLTPMQQARIRCSHIRLSIGPWVNRFLVRCRRFASIEIVFVPIKWSTFFVLADVIDSCFSEERRAVYSIE